MKKLRAIHASSVSEGKKKKELKQKKNELEHKKRIPTYPRNIRYNLVVYGDCPTCGGRVWEIDSGCSKCGQRILWEMTVKKGFRDIEMHRFKETE